jgi:hypothetical protein
MTLNFEGSVSRRAGLNEVTNHDETGLQIHAGGFGNMIAECFSYILQSQFRGTSLRNQRRMR